MTNTNEAIMERLNELLDAGQPAETAADMVVREICRDEVGCTPAQYREDILNALDLIEAQRFLQITPGFPSTPENGKRLWDRACEIAGHEHAFLCHLQAAYEELAQAGGLEPEPEDKPEPAPQPAPAPNPQPLGITKTGRTGTPLITPEERARLSAISLLDLRKLAAQSRFARMSESRKLSLRNRGATPLVNDPRHRES